MACTARLRTTAAAVALTAVLAACSGGAEPEAGASPEQAASPTSTAPVPSASPSPSVSASAADGKPERPAAMEQHDADGAAAALEYFLALDPYAMRTGDIDELEAMSHASCDYCALRIDQARTIAERGDVYSGGLARATILTTYERDAATGIWPLDVEIREEGAQITDQAGEEVFSSPGGTAERRAEMGLVDDQWVVVEIGPLPED